MINKNDGYQRISLNGTWNLAAGDNRPDFFKHRVPVPALVDVAEPPLDWEKYDYFLYQTTFSLPENASFERLFLQLEQVQYGTEIWLNGQPVGGDIPCYTSQEFDLTKFVRRDRENELLVRVGAKHTLPEHAAVGQDFEKMCWIPGIWGDVWLHLYGVARVDWTRIIPNIENGSVNLKCEISSFSHRNEKLLIHCVITPRNSENIVAQSDPEEFTIWAEDNYTFETTLWIRNPQLWSPERPFLYRLAVYLIDDHKLAYMQKLSFGMRGFEIREGHFYLNGKRRVLMGGNICFHRLLSDPRRGILPWNMDWAKKALVDIPKSHNMSFFRFHLGRAYNRWYDLADEHGVMLQDEWMFWTTTGSPEQIEKEFTAWIKAHGHHPSVVVWDALNESEDERVTGEIIPKMKALDPTRPWEMVDFGEDHPYIYSLGPLLNAKKFGYSRSIFDLQKSITPVMVNEYIWWWLDSRGNPTELTKIVLERWLGRNPTKEKLLEHQAFLAEELTELWRRLNLDAIMPFVYLSCDGGATANWFSGALAVLTPKPIITALKNAFSPLGVSIELWDRHFLCEESRNIAVYLFNDTDAAKTARLKRCFDPTLKELTEEQEQVFILKAGEHRKARLPVAFPKKPGEYRLRVAIFDENDRETAHSEKIIHVFSPDSTPQKMPFSQIVLFDHSPANELQRTLTRFGLTVHAEAENLTNSEMAMINGRAIAALDKSAIARLTECVANGGILLVQEPEFGVENEARYPLLKNLDIVVQKRADPERGGYDSHVFPEDARHFLWKKIAPEHLRIFNGGFGGEMVSQHNVRPTRPYRALARCHLSLLVPAVMEIPYGNGGVIISRIQLRGRLLPERSESELYGRRYDPVAEQFLRNLLAGYQRQSLEKQILAENYISHVRISSGEVHDPGDGTLQLHWGSKIADPQWIWLDFGDSFSCQWLTLTGDAAFAKSYRIRASNDNQHWKTVHEKTDVNNAEINIECDKIKKKFWMIEILERNEPGGYSIFQLRAHNGKQE